MLGLWNAPVAQLFLRRDARATPSAAFALGGWAGAPATTQHRYHTPTSAAWRSLDLTYLEATTHSLLRIWPALARHLLLRSHPIPPIYKRFRLVGLAFGEAPVFAL